MHKLSLTPLPLCSCVHCASSGVPDARGWLRSTGQVILSTRLFSDPWMHVDGSGYATVDGHNDTSGSQVNFLCPGIPQNVWAFSFLWVNPWRSLGEGLEESLLYIFPGDLFTFAIKDLGSENWHRPSWLGNWARGHNFLLGQLPSAFWLPILAFFWLYEATLLLVSHLSCP